MYGKFQIAIGAVKHGGNDAMETAGGRSAGECPTIMTLSILIFPVLFPIQLQVPVIPGQSSLTLPFQGSALPQTVTMIKKSRVPNFSDLNTNKEISVLSYGKDRCRFACTIRRCTLHCVIAFHIIINHYCPEPVGKPRLLHNNFILTILESHGVC